MSALEVIADCNVCLGDVLSAPHLDADLKKNKQKLFCLFLFYKESGNPN